MAQRILEGVVPASTVGTVLGTFEPALAAAGVEISEARLAAIFGHAFTFSMANGGGDVSQLANIEWCLFFRDIELVGCRVDHFDASLKGAPPAPSPDELQKMKTQTWEKVKASIDRGVPGIAWGVMTVEQCEQGINGWEWSLLVGYDESEKSYVVRNQNNGEPWSVGYDQFGYIDGVQWYHVMVPAGPKRVDPELQLTRTLEQAVDYAHGTRMPPGATNSYRKADYIYLYIFILK